MQSIIIAIPGVGNTTAGSVCSAVRESLGAIAEIECCPVHEVSWPSRVAHPIDSDGLLRASAVGEVSKQLAYASLMRSTGSLRPTRLNRLLLMGQEIAFSACETAIATMFALLLMATPVLLVFRFTSFNFDAPAFNIIQVVGFVLRLVMFFVLASASTFFCFGFLLSLATARVDLAWVTIRRLALVLLRPGILAVAAIFVVPWRGLALLSWAFLRRAVPVLALLLVLIGAVLILLLGQEIPSWTDIKIVSVELVVLFIAPGATALLALLLAVVVGPTLKVLLDIFRYASSAEYRLALQRYFSETVSESRLSHPGVKHFIIVSHSLGSVVALDSLVSSACWSSTDKVTLVTLGSPIRRFFVRFFPRSFFPVSIDGCFSIIGSRLGGFRWINCYRPWDQIGSSLGIGSRPFGMDICTKQYGRFFTSHLDYWSDPRVLSSIAPLYKTLRFLQVKEGPAIQYIRESTNPLGHRRILHFASTWLPVLLICISLLANVVLSVQGGRSFWRAYVERCQNIRRGGLETVTTVRVWTEVSLVGGMNVQAVSTDFASFDFQDNTSTFRSLTFRDHPDDYRESISYFADEAKLRRYVIAQGHSMPDRRSAPGKIFVDSSLHLKYLRSDPRYFLVTEFPPRLTFWTVVIDISEGLLPPLAIMMMVALALYLICWPFLRTFISFKVIGLPAEL